jgi:hypothetical protein
VALTIFYSWQSDIPNKINRTFIENALKDAIKIVGREGEVQAALRMDRDTQDVPGMPAIVETIF